MKTIIAGSRNIPKGTSWRDVEIMLDGTAKTLGITEVVSGGAYGADRIGENWAKDNGIPIKRFPYLSELGKAGGPVRNRQMADYADELIAVWDGHSRGTKNMISEMEKRGKKVHLIILGVRML